MSHKSMDDKFDLIETYTDLLTWVWEVFATEWRQRTWFGKLFYPFWATMRLLLALTVVTFMSPFIASELIDWLSSHTGRAWRWVRGHFPRTYKIDDGNGGSI